MLWGTQAEDVLRIAALPQEQKGQEVTAAQLLWVDRLGVYFKAQATPSPPTDMLLQWRHSMVREESS